MSFCWKLPPSALCWLYLYSTVFCQCAASKPENMKNMFTTSVALLIVHAVLFSSLCSQNKDLWSLHMFRKNKAILLDGFQRHPFPSTADHILKSILYGRCGALKTIGLYSLLKVEPHCCKTESLQSRNATVVRHRSMLDFSVSGGYQRNRGRTHLHARF